MFMNRKPFLSGLWSMREIIGDRDRYNSTAKAIAFYGKIDRAEGRPVLYPFFLAIFYFLFGYNVYSFLIPQIMLAAVNTVLVFLLAQRLFGNEKIPLIASLLHAANPHFILTSIQLYSETLYFFLLLSLFLLFKKVLSQPAAKNSIAAGAFMGLAALCRTVFLVFVPFIFSWLIMVFLHRKRRLLTITFGLFLSFSLIYSLSLIINPWIFHRFSVYGVIKDGLHGLDGELPVRSPEIRKYREQYDDRDNQELFYTLWLKDNPGQYFNFCKQRLKTFLFKACPEGVSLRHKAVSSFIFYLIFPLGYLGIIAEVIKRQRLPLLILFYILATTALHVLAGLDGELRYRLPIELFMCMFAPGGACIGIKLWKRLVKV